MRGKGDEAMSVYLPTYLPTYTRRYTGKMKFLPENTVLLVQFNSIVGGVFFFFLFLLSME